MAKKAGDGGTVPDRLLTETEKDTRELSCQMTAETVPEKEL